MVTGDAVADAVAIARSMPSLAVGLHLVLAQARPAAPVGEIPRLVDARGRFRDAPVLSGFQYAIAALGRVGHAQIRREIEAQLEAFAATGLELAHVDGHLNMHLHPLILPILLDLAPRFGIHAVRLSRESLRAALRHDRRHAMRKSGEGVVFRWLASMAAPRLRAAGIVTADRVYGIHHTRPLDAAYLLAPLAPLPPGVRERYRPPPLRQPPPPPALPRG